MAMDFAQVMHTGMLDILKPAFDSGRLPHAWLICGQGGIGNTIVGLLVLGVLNNGLDHVPHFAAEGDPGSRDRYYQQMVNEV